MTIDIIRDKLAKVINSLPYCLYTLQSVSSNNGAITVSILDQMSDEPFEFESQIDNGNAPEIVVKQFIRYIKSTLVDSYKASLGEFKVVATIGDLLQKLMQCSKKLFDQVDPALVDTSKVINLEIAEVCNKKQICFMLNDKKMFMDIDSLSYFAWKQLLRKMSIQHDSLAKHFNELPPQCFQSNYKTAKFIMSVVLESME